MAVSMMRYLLLSALLCHLSAFCSASGPCVEKCCFAESFPQYKLQIPQNCSLLIVAAGFPRSGSTWTYELVMQVLRIMNVQYYDAYWRYHEHSSMPEEHMQRYINSFNRHSATSTNDFVFVLKAHEYDEDLMSACGGRVLIITGYRHLLEVARSIHNLQWTSDMDSLVSCYDLWSRVAHLNFKYEIAKANPGMYAVSVASAISTHLHRVLPTAQLDMLARMPQGMSSAPRAENALESTLSKEERDTIFQRHCRWLVLHGYDCIAGGSSL